MMTKTTIATILTILISALTSAQNIVGDWHGEVQGSKGPIVFVFHIEKDNGKLITLVDVPTNRVAGLKPKSTSFETNELLVDGSNLGIKYQGTITDSDDEIIGKFTEGANTFPLNLKRGVPKTSNSTRRPQEPVKPYPYKEENVSFENIEDQVSLFGTITLPKNNTKKHTAVVLISGSGPQDRNQTFSGHKTFLVLADYLTRNGIAVLRFDDRGFGESTGDFSKATTEDFAKDVLSAVEYLKSRTDIDHKSIGLIGHSEGGIIAPLTANQTKDVSFLVLLASTGIPGSELSLAQSKSLRPFPVPSEEEYEAAVRKAIDIASSDMDLTLLKKKLKEHYQLTIAPILKPMIGSDEKVNEAINGLIESRTTPWIRYFYNYNPADQLEKIKIPVLSLNGSKDSQVNADINQDGIRKALIKAKNKDFRILKIENLNHLFQECETGSMQEYSQIQQTISPVALKEISNWILERTGK